MSKKRLLVNLDDDDKQWLDRTSAREGISQSELVREALASYRARQAPSPDRIQQLLQNTRGTWHHGDGLAYQSDVRDEWNRDE